MNYSKSRLNWARFEIALASLLAHVEESKVVAAQAATVSLKELVVIDRARGNSASGVIEESLAEAVESPGAGLEPAPGDFKGVGDA